MRRSSSSPLSPAAAQSRGTDWRLNVASLHVQKTGGTELYLLCEAPAAAAASSNASAAAAAADAQA